MVLFDKIGDLYQIERVAILSQQVNILRLILPCEQSCRIGSLYYDIYREQKLKKGHLEWGD